MRLTIIATSLVRSSRHPSTRSTTKLQTLYFLLLQDLCEILTALQQDAPKHSYAKTRAQIERSFGHPIEAIFDSFEEQPLASASIAQVTGT